MARRSADPTSLYKMDDYLNKLSIDQLRSELQRPTGGAPAFMVASKLQEKLREKSAAAQRPASTVAEDLMGGQAAMQRPQEAGIGSLVPRDVASIPREMSAMPRDVASEAPMMSMARGGIVRMSDGDEVKAQDLRQLSDEALSNYYRQFDLPESKQGLYRLNPDLPPASLEQIQGEISRRQYLGGQFSGENYRNAVLGQFNKIPLTAADIARQQAEAIPEVAIPPVGLSGPTTSTFPSSTPTSSSMPPAAVGSSSQAAQPDLPLVPPGDYPQAETASQNNAGSPITSPPGDYPQSGPVRQGATRPAQGGGRGGAGLPSLRAAPATPGVGGGFGGGGGGGAGIPSGAPGGLPSISGGMAGSPTAALQARMEASDAEYDKVMKEMRENRPNKEQLKEDAKWRFLAQLGAGMAAGTGNFARAFGGALGPAMQSYGEEMKSIRKEIQESYKGDLDAYKAKSEALYRSGKLSQDEFHVRMQVAGQLEAARIHAGATMAASGVRHAGQFTDQQKADMLLSDDPKVRAVGEQLFGRYHQRDFASEAKERIAHNIQTEFRAELATLTNNLPSVGQSATQRRQEIENQLRDKYNKMYLDRLMAVGASGISSAPAGNILGSYGSGNP